MPIFNQVVKGSGGSAPALCREFQLDANGKLVPNTTTTHIMDFTGVKELPAYILLEAYKNNTAISGVVDMSDLITINGSSACQSMFYGCTGITSVDLSSLTTISGSNACNSMFYDCSNLTSANLSSLVSTSNCVGMFSGCSSLTNVDLSSLTTLDVTGVCASMFAQCTSLTSLSFPAITTSSFGTRVNQFNNMCQGVTGITLHFPSNVQSQVEALTGYSTTTPFGAVSGTVLFDLPATN